MRLFRVIGLFFLTAFFILHSGGFPAKAQTSEAQNKKEGKQEEKGDEEVQESFANYGIISVSNRHELSKDRQHVSFNIINNSGRSITNLFGWVYRYEEGEAGKKTNYVLVNFPHKGGVGENIMSHKPGRKAKWRFLLKRAVPQEENPPFLLLVNMNSIFFAKTETIEPDQAVEPDQTKKDEEEKK